MSALGAARVVRAEVEEPVELLEGLGEVGRSLVEAARGEAEVAREGAGHARERADLVADLRSGLPHEGQHGRVGLVQLAEGRAQRLQRGAEAVAEGVDLAQGGLRLTQRARQLAHGVGDLRVRAGQGVEHLVGGAHQPHDLAVLGGHLLGEQAVLVDQVLEVACGGGRSRCVTRSVSRLSGPEPGEGLLEVAAAALQALAGAGDQQLEVVARVAVERGQDLVRVDVGRGVRGPDAAARGQRLAGARVHLEEHVLEPGLGAQQRGGVLLDVALVLLLELHRDHGLAVLELDLADLADLHAGGAHRLALSGLDRLGVGQLDLHLQRLLLDQREAQALVGEDERADPAGQQHEGQDRHEVAEVLAECLPHRCSSASVSPTVSSARRRSMAV